MAAYQDVTAADLKLSGDPRVSNSPARIPNVVRRSRSPLVKATCALLLISVILLVSPPSALLRSQSHPVRSLARSAVTSVTSRATPLLEVFQIYQPVLTVTPQGVFELTDGTSNVTVELAQSEQLPCEQDLVEYSFANSYGQPFVGHYAPPQCSFNRVTWNLTVVAAGRQYDRLGIVYLGNVEVFRTSTAEPTADGITWTYIKDMTPYVSLFEEHQKLIFDLGNLVNNIYTAALNVTLTATYFTAPDSVTPADLIVPVSARKASQNQASVFTVPSDTASNNLTLPQNVKRAVFTVSATGQSDEEFWWSNAPQSDVDTFPGAELFGYSPFREVQLYIDGLLAGVAWPFPIIFTGGVVPGLWRPLVGIDAFDLKEDEIDITPWLPVLCDGRAHNFTIRVSGLNDDGNGGATLSEATDTYWLVTGKVFVWLDTAGHITTGTTPVRHFPAPELSILSTVDRTGNGTNETLLYQVNAKRSLSVHSTIRLSSGHEATSWQQSLAFSNVGNVSAGGNNEVNTQSTKGLDVSSSGYMKSFSYPLYAFSVFGQNGDNISISAIVNRGKEVKTLGQPVFPTGLESFSPTEYVHRHDPTFEGAWLYTTQNGTATYLANETAETSFSFGTTKQDFTFSGIEAHVPAHAEGFPPISGSSELFHRYVEAVNGTVVEDSETLLDSSIEPPYRPQPGDNAGYALKHIPGHPGHWPPW